MVNSWKKQKLKKRSLRIATKSYTCIVDIKGPNDGPLCIKGTMNCTVQAHKPKGKNGQGKD